MNPIKSIRALRRNLAALALIALAAFSLAPVAQAQITTGSYVVPRPATIYNGFVTNGVTYTTYATNLLNPFGWHNGTFALSESQNNGNTNSIGTNQVTINVYGQIGPSSSYTNAAAGTNFATSTAPLITWVNNVTATNTYGSSMTNVSQTQGDGYGIYKVTIAVGCTNQPAGGFILQLDYNAIP